ncbi:hypothetical protein GCM10020254_83300 [Streptomyces goshikiensis]
MERTIARLHGFRRLGIRWERRDDIHEAFLSLTTCLTSPADTVQRPGYRVPEDDQEPAGQ